jgi:PAS domain S-box-containing protein
MKLNFYQKLTALFLIFFVGIGIMGFLAFRNNLAFDKNAKWVEHTQLVLDESEKIFALTQSIANGERGYIITGNREFLQPFIIARERIFLQIGTLKSLTADNPVQQARIDSINIYAQKRIDITTRIIEAVDEKNISAADSIISGKEGKNISIKIRGFETAIQTDENNLLKERKEASLMRIEVINRFLYGLFASLLVLLTLSYFGFWHNHMRQNKLEGEARSTNHFLNMILENIPNMIFVKDARDLKFVRFNRAGEKLLGRMRDELIGKNDFDLFPKEQAQAYINKDREVLVKGDVVDIPEEPVTTNDGDKWLHTKKIAIIDETGKPKYLLGISEDITGSRQYVAEIKQLNSELEKTVNQLTSANKEMEAFTYSVSHDLRAPLRIIDGFGEILLKDYSSAFDEEGKITLAVIMSNAKHMGQLIDDLLNLSRLGRAQLAIKKTDMREVVEDVLQAMSMMNPEMAKADIRVHALRPCVCDVSLIRQVWINLVSNAVKYSRKREHPVIDIGWEDKNGQTIYYVKDNGAGFDMKYYKKLFGVFQRLHKISEFEGTGVGLALVHRIITKHNGKIWAEAIENEGATFYFTIPD